MGPDLGVDEARRQAVLILGGHARDEAAPDPVARRSARSEAVREPVVRRSAPKPTRQVEPVKQPEQPRPTVRELAGRFAEEYVAVYLKGGSKANYRRHLAEHILPALGDRDFESVTRSDVQRLHASLRTIPATANYVVNVIGSLYKRIITDWELSDMRHPTHGVKLFKMRVRERFLSPEERQRVHEAMEAGLRIPAGRKGHLEPRSVWALQLLSLTGLRRDEIRDLTWPMVDLAARLPAPPRHQDRPAHGRGPVAGGGAAAPHPRSRLLSSHSLSLRGSKPIQRSSRAVRRGGGRMAFATCACMCLLRFSSSSWLCGYWRSLCQAR
jgi:hypothetical protein